MTGPYDSVIGVEREIILRRFLTSLPDPDGSGQGGSELHAVIVDVDDSGRATAIERMLIAEEDLKRL